MKTSAFALVRVAVRGRAGHGRVEVRRRNAPPEAAAHPAGVSFSDQLDRLSSSRFAGNQCTGQIGGADACE
jgi:hypothetical protein